MKRASRHGTAAQRETFFMSNIVPQKPDLNRRIWRLLEERIAKDYAIDFEEVWIITGPVYDEQKETLKSVLEIPDAFFKITREQPVDCHPCAFGRTHPVCHSSLSENVDYHLARRPGTRVLGSALPELSA